jgi:hypothetical protein
MWEQTLTVERAALVDDGHNNQVRDWSTAVTHDIDWCSIQPGATSEFLQGRDESVISYTVFAPDGADILSSDRVLIDGNPFSINGEIIRWQTGILDHTVVFLQRWEG